MKNLFFLLFVVFSVAYAKAQITEGKLTIEKTDQPAVVGNFPFSEDIVSSVIQDDLKYKGFGKGDEKKGITKFIGILFTDISTEKIDFYYKVEGNKKDENSSTVYILVSKGYDNFVSGANGSDVFKAAKKYLEGLTPKFEAKKLEMDIANQEKVVRDAEKKYNNAVSDGKNLADKKAKLEDQIKENTKSQEDTKATLDKEQKLLETLKGKKK